MGIAEISIVIIVAAVASIATVAVLNLAKAIIKFIIERHNAKKEDDNKDNDEQA